MQLTDLRVDAFGSVRNVALDRLAGGLTGVYGSNGSGKTTVLQFLRGAFGDRSASFWSHTHTTPSGHVDVLTRDGGRQHVAVKGAANPTDLLDSKTLARLATVTAAEANDTELVERLARDLGVTLEDHTVDRSQERAAHIEQTGHRGRLTASNGPIAAAEAELQRLDRLIAGLEAEHARTSERLASQADALRAAYHSTLADAARVHGDYQAVQSDETEWQTDAWRARRVTTRVEVDDVETPTTPVHRDGTSLKAALLEIAQLRCKASARRAEAAAAGPLELCGQSHTTPLAIANEIRLSLDRLRSAAGTVPAAGLSTRIDDLITSIDHQQRIVDWLDADRTRVLLDQCERDIESAALRRCSVCATGPTACDQHTCTTQQSRTVDVIEPPADAALGQRLTGTRRELFPAWQAALSRHRQARRQLAQFDIERHRHEHDNRLAELLRERDAASARLASLLDQLNDLNKSIAALEAILAEERPPSGPLHEAGRYFQRLTCRHYAGLTRNKTDRHAVRALTASGHNVALSELSRGTQAQAALAMRLAVLDELAGRGVFTPLLLDDVLVDSDRDRALAGVQLLAEWSRHRQTILMTCQRQLIDAMTESGVEIRQLTGRSVAPQPTQKHTSRRETVVARVTEHTTPKEPAARVLPITPAKTIARQTPTEVRESALNVTAATPTTKASVAKTSVTQTPAESYWLDPDSMIVRVPSIHETSARRIGSIGVESIEHLVLVDADAIEADLIELQINPRDFVRWQAEARLLTLVPGLAARDAQLLAWAGIDTPEELADIHIDALRQRLTQIRNHGGAASLRSETETWSDDRLNRWRSRARRSRSRDGLFTRRPKLRSVRDSRRDRRSTSEDSSSAVRTLSVVERRRALRRDGDRDRDRNSSRSSMTSEGRSKRGGKKRDHKQRDRQESATTTEWRHYLETDSPVVDAPSIGPKMAKRLSKHRIKTVTDLLNADAGSLAKALDDRRIKKQTIIDWQDQARLMCRIPMLRGHDAQVLVACDFRDTAAVAASEPKAMFAIVGPFVKTKEGERVLRSSKVPDLDEVTDWITWARHARALKAA